MNEVTDNYHDCHLLRQKGDVSFIVLYLLTCRVTVISWRLRMSLGRWHTMNTNTMNSSTMAFLSSRLLLLLLLMIAMQILVLMAEMAEKGSSPSNSSRAKVMAWSILSIKMEINFSSNL